MQNKIYVSWVVLLFLLAAFLVALVSPWVEKPQEAKYISDRLEDCEAQGGRYYLFWAEYRGNYYEGCEVPEKEINEF